MITGPDFKGEVPGEMTQVRSRTKRGVAAVRIFVVGTMDLPGAVEAQEGFRLMPLSAYLRYGLAYSPPSSRPLIPAYGGTAPPDIRAFDEMGFGIPQRLSATADSTDALIASFAPIGLSVARGFEWQKLDEPTKRGLARAAKTGAQIMDSEWASAGEIVNGWKHMFASGRAGFGPLQHWQYH